MTFDGTLTWEEFLNCAKFILSVSDTIKDGWSLEGLKGKCKDGDLNKVIFETQSSMQYYIIFMPFLSCFSLNL